MDCPLFEIDLSGGFGMCKNCGKPKADHCEAALRPAPRKRGSSVAKRWSVGSRGSPGASSSPAAQQHQREMASPAHHGIPLPGMDKGRPTSRDAPAAPIKGPAKGRGISLDDVDVKMDEAPGLAELNRLSYGAADSLKLLKMRSEKDDEGYMQSKVEVASGGQRIFADEAPGRTEVNAVMIFGKLGQGKSFLMNTLAGETVFGVSDGADTFTQGADISTHFMEHPTDDSAPKMAFVDVEGQGGDRSEGYSLKLATPLILTSKIVIMNITCTTRIDVKELDKLQIIMSTAEKMKFGSQSKAFGHLHVIFRDCIRTDEEAMEKLLGDEDPKEAKDRQGKKDAQERNNTRDDIKDFFASVSVWCLPHPTPGRTPNGIGDAQPDFLNKVNLIRATMMDQMRAPMRFSGSPMTGSSFPAVLQELAQKINDDEDIDPPSMQDAINERIAGTAEQACLVAAEREFQGLLEEVKSGPIQTLQPKIDAIEGPALEAFERALDVLDKELYQDLFKASLDKVAEQLKAKGALIHETNDRLLAEELARKEKIDAEAKEMANEAKGAVVAAVNDSIKEWETRGPHDDAAVEAFAANVKALAGSMLQRWTAQAEVGDSKDAVQANKTAVSGIRAAIDQILAEKEAATRARNTRAKKLENDRKAAEIEKRETEARLQREKKEREEEARRARQEAERREREHHEQLARQKREQEAETRRRLAEQRAEQERREREYQRQLERERERAEQERREREYQRQLERERERAAAAARAAAASYSYGGGYGGSGYGGSGRSSSGGGKFYKGGQFMPGGGRAPKGGAWG